MNPVSSWTSSPSFRRAQTPAGARGEAGGDRFGPGRPEEHLIRARRHVVKLAALAHPQLRPLRRPRGPVLRVIAQACRSQVHRLHVVPPLILSRSTSAPRTLATRQSSTSIPSNRTSSPTRGESGAVTRPHLVLRSWARVQRAGPLVARFDACSSFSARSLTE